MQNQEHRLYWEDKHDTSKVFRFYYVDQQFISNGVSIHILWFQQEQI